MIIRLSKQAKQLIIKGQESSCNSHKAEYSIKLVRSVVMWAIICNQVVTYKVEMDTIA